VNPTNRQPSGKVGNLWVIAGENSKLQLACSPDCQLGVVLSESCTFRLAVAVDAEQNDGRRTTRG
jgi:hypothetical protein